MRLPNANLLLVKCRLIVTISIGFFLTACHDDTELKRELSIAETKLALATSKAESNLISKIDKSNQNYSIQFENGDALSIQSQWIKKVEYDSLTWIATFLFSDNTSQTAYFVGKLAINEKAIFVNPYLASPLTAVVEIQTPVKGKFKVVVKGKPGGGVTLEKSLPYHGDHHILPILGLYENYANQVEFIFVNHANKVRCSKSIIIQTSAIQNKPALEIDIVKNQLGDSYKGFYVISNLKLGFDQTGEIRWYYEGDGASFFGKLKNGNFLVSDATNKFFYEVTMLGQRVKKYSVPNGLHHEIAEMPNGNFLVASHSPPGHPLEDVVDEISRTTGQVTRSWDFNTILDPNRKTLPDIWDGDWLHINAMYYDATDNSIVISGRSQCAVVKIDYATGAIKWILGNHNEWNNEFGQYFLTPVDNAGNVININNIDFWPYGQHAISRLPNGNILLYDNGTYRGFYDNPNVAQESYTRIVEYKINEQLKTVELVWQFENNKSVFTMFTGFTQNLSDTRLAAYMWVSPSTPRIVEVDRNNQIVFEATINKGKSSYYRTMKVGIYE